MSVPTTPLPYQARLEYAEEDARNARSLSRGRKPSWRGACFNAQQSAEKVPKALPIYHGQQPRRPHILEDPLQQCGQYEPMLVTLLPDCVLLTPYAVVTRYPDTGHLPVTKEEARDALAVLALLPA